MASILAGGVEISNLLQINFGGQRFCFADFVANQTEQAHSSLIFDSFTGTFAFDDF